MGFGQVRQDGIARMDTILIATEIVAPLMLQLMLMLCLPYAVVKGGCLLAGMSPIEMAAPVRFSYGALGLGGLSLKAQSGLPNSSWGLCRGGGGGSRWGESEVGTR